MIPLQNYSVNNYRLFRRIYEHVTIPLQNYSVNSTFLEWYVPG